MTERMPGDAADARRSSGRADRHGHPQPARGPQRPVSEVLRLLPRGHGGARRRRRRRRGHPHRRGPGLLRRPRPEGAGLHGRQPRRCAGGARPGPPRRPAGPPGPVGADGQAGHRGGQRRGRDRRLRAGAVLRLPRRLRAGPLRRHPRPGRRHARLGPHRAAAPGHRPAPGPGDEPDRQLHDAEEALRFGLVNHVVPTTSCCPPPAGWPPTSSATTSPACAASWPPTPPWPTARWPRAGRPRPHGPGMADRPGCQRRVAARREGIMTRGRQQIS